MPSLSDYLRKNGQHSLFPLAFVEEILSYCHESLEGKLQHLLKNNDPFSLSQQVFGAKRGRHLRRTILLDPLAQYALFHCVFANRLAFRHEPTGSRRCLGFGFDGNVEVSTSFAHRALKRAIYQSKKRFRVAATFDISSYFNTIYHHELIAWFERTTSSAESAQLLGKILREVNAGKSVDCLPQGISPAKIIGAHYLKEIDNHNQLRSRLMLRFMDDFYLFSNDMDNIHHDFALIQQLLGARGLDLNPAKTVLGTVEMVDPRQVVDETRRGLIEQYWIRVGYDEYDVSIQERPLNEKEIAYLHDLLEQDDMTEEDAALVLALLVEQSDDQIQHFRQLVEQFPALARQAYTYASKVDDKAGITTALLELVLSGKELSEYQLFWFGRILADWCAATPNAGSLAFALLQHPGTSSVTKAAVLESGITGFGLMDERVKCVRSGQHGWEVWASMSGLRNLDRASRNQLLKYAGRGHPVSDVIAQYVSAWSK